MGDAGAANGRNGAANASGAGRAREPGGAPGSAGAPALAGAPEQTGALIVGAGPAGLAMAACLKRAGVPYVLLERGERVGWAWHNHYERLRLHTVKEHSSLPFLPFPEDTPRYPSRRQVVDYLERYARELDLRPRLGEDVTRLARQGGRWTAETAAGHHYVADAVVVASGYNRSPHAPAWPGMERFHGRVLHSAAYRSGAEFRGQRVLVVGIGNTGAEIALDLAEQGARPSIAVRGGVNIVPRDVRGRPAQVTNIRLLWLPARLRDAVGRLMSRLTFGDLSRYGLRPLPYGPVTQIERYGRLPVIDVGTVERVKRGEIEILPGPGRFTETGVVFTDGVERAFDAVVLATGYRPALADFLDDAAAVVDPCGYPPGDGAAAIPGLFFLGFARPKAGILRQIGLDAPAVAEQVAEYVRRTAGDR